jgi:hypothetical protein
MVHYRISDPKNFWNGLESKLSQIPQDARLVFSAPNVGGTQLTTLWESGDDPSGLQQYLRQTAGSQANFETMEVDISRVRNLSY